MKYIIVICLAFFSIESIAQSDKNLTTHSISEVKKDFTYENETSEQEVNISVNQQSEYVAFRFDGTIEKGKLVITILDPNEKKEGGFELEVQKSTGRNSNSNSSSNNNKIHSYTFTSTTGGKASGNMTKQIDNPVMGKWIIQIKAIDVVGELRVNMAQSDH